MIDLRGPSETQLIAVGLDTQLASRIVTAARTGPGFTSVDDLLRVQEMDRQTLEKIRPHVRIGLPGRPRIEQFVAAN